ncbi:uncharacterized protein LOC144020976 [Festucalex cinctus]
MERRTAKIRSGEKMEVTSSKRGEDEEAACQELVHLFNNLKCFDSIYLNNVLIDMEFKASQSITESDVSMLESLMDFMEARNHHDNSDSDSADSGSDNSIQSSGVDDPDSFGD